MKKLILSCIILLCTLNNTQAQNTPLNKQQTIDYIDKLFTSTFISPTEKIKIESVTVDGKVLVINIDNGHTIRKSLLVRTEWNGLEIGFDSTHNTRFFIGYKKELSQSHSILWCIQTEEDAKRLKKALEHLIEILKTEKNTDPFGE